MISALVPSCINLGAFSADPTSKTFSEIFANHELSPKGTGLIAVV